MGIADTLSNAAAALTDLLRTPIAPQALAEEASTMADGVFVAGTGLQLVDEHVTFQQMYQRQPVLAGVIDKRADLLATLPVRVWDTTPATGNRLDIDTPLTRLLRDPTGGKMPGGAYAFWRWMSATRDITGEAFALKMRDESGTVVALHPMIPTRVTVKRDETGTVIYSFQLGRTSSDVIRVAEDDVLRWLNFNPHDIMRGMSKLEPLRQSLAVDDAARKAARAAWANGARPGVAISYPKELTQKATEKIRTQFRARHSGPAGWGDAVVLDEGMTVTKMQLDLDELKYVESRKLTVEEVCAVFDMPPAAVHMLLEQASFSSTTEQLRSLGRDTMPPICQSLQDVLDTQLVAEFHPDGSRIVEFGLDQMIRGDWETIASLASGLIQGGVATPNELRPLLGLPKYEGHVADELYANQATLPLGTVPDAAPADGIAPADDEPAEPVTARRYTVTRRALGMSGRITAKATRQDMRDTTVAQQRKAVAAALRRQMDAVGGAWDTYGDVPDGYDADDLAADLYAPEDWDDDLADELADPTTAAVDAFGKRVAGKGFDVSRAQAWIDANVTGSASSMNQATASRLSDLLGTALASDDVQTAVGDALDQLRDYLLGARADQVADTRATSLAGFGEHEGAAQAGKKTKTWVVNSGNPRASHAALDGETVDLDATFSNGAKWPGDPSLDVDEIAGCDCSLDF